MKSVIRVKGVSGTGKTSAILRLIGLLEEDGVQVFKCAFGAHDMVAFCFIDECRVLISSVGDNPDVIEEAVELAESHTVALEEYDIFVTAVRTKGGTIEITDNYAKEYNCGIREYLSEKYVAADEGDIQEANLKFATHLYEQIKVCCNE